MDKILLDLKEKKISTYGIKFDSLTILEFFESIVVNFSFYISNLQDLGTRASLIVYRSKEIEEITY